MIQIVQTLNSNGITGNRLLISSLSCTISPTRITKHYQPTASLLVSTTMCLELQITLMQWKSCKNYVKQKNELSACRQLATRNQDPRKNVHQFYQTLSKDCQFKAVSADDHRDGYIHDYVISGLSSTHIRQCLLETDSFTFQEALQKARSLDSAQTQANSLSLQDLHQSPRYVQLLSHEAHLIRKDLRRCNCVVSL